MRLSLGPVSRKSRELFGPAKPLLVNLLSASIVNGGSPPLIMLYLKIERCIRLKLLLWREPLLILPIQELINDNELLTNMWKKKKRKKEKKKRLGSGCYNFSGGQGEIWFYLQGGVKLTRVIIKSRQRQSYANKLFLLFFANNVTFSDKVPTWTSWNLKPTCPASQVSLRGNKRRRRWLASDKDNEGKRSAKLA